MCVYMYVHDINGQGCLLESNVYELECVWMCGPTVNSGWWAVKATIVAMCRGTPYSCVVHTCTHTAVLVTRQYAYGEACLM